jgi:long-chain fatty acid transport protein
MMFVIPCSIYAEGIGIWAMGTRSNAMGGVATASAFNPTAVFFNPAGMSRMDGAQLTLSGSTIYGEMEFQGVDPWPGYGNVEIPAAEQELIPQFYFATPITDKFSAGIGFNTPYGLGFGWENPSEFDGRHISFQSDIRTYYFYPSISWQATEKLAIGVTVPIVRGSLMMKQYARELVPDPVEFAIGTIEGETPSNAYGVVFGMVADLGDGFNMGINYRSPVTLNLDGEISFEPLDNPNGIVPPDDSLGTGVIPLPGLFSLGFSYESGQMFFETDVNLATWSNYDVLELQIDNPEIPSLSLPQEFRDVWSMRFGGEYTFLNGGQLRAGFFHDSVPQPSSRCGPALPDWVHRGLSCGFGIPIKSAQFDAFLVRLFMPTRKVRDSADGFNGDYRATALIYGAGITFDL